MTAPESSRSLSATTAEPVPVPPIAAPEPPVQQPRPSWFRRGAVFLFLVSMYAATTACVITGLLSVNIATIEKRYGLSSRESAGFQTSFQVAQLLCVFPVSMLASRLSKPVILSAGLALFCTGCLIFPLPQLVFGEYELSGIVPGLQLCVPSNVSSAGCAINSRNAGAYRLMVFGSMLMGMGVSPLYVLAPAYFVENGLRANLYMGVFMCVAMFGPAVGFLFGGSMLSLWVDPGKKPAGASEDDATWVGRWWLGYVVFGFVGALWIVPLALFPAVLDAKRYVPQAVHSAREHMRSILHAVARPSFVFLTLASACESFYISAMALFVTKFTASVYSLPASRAGLLVGLVIVPGAGFGMLTGGMIGQRWLNTTRRMMAFVLVTSTLSFFLSFIFLLGCGSVLVAGVNAPFEPSALAAGACRNASCACSPWPFAPVCGSDGINYFSACEAGCTSASAYTRLTSAVTLSGCRCISGARAQFGLCKKNCPNLSIFLVLLLVLLFLSTLPMPIALKIVSDIVGVQHASTSLGLNSLAFRLLGSVPGPLVLGALLDSACSLWEMRCGERFQCYLYDSDTIRATMTRFLVSLRVFSISLLGAMLVAWVFRDEARAPQLQHPQHGQHAQLSHHLQHSRSSTKPASVAAT